jgi:hypothetical protein
VLQDDTHYHQDVTDHARILGDPRDKRHIKIHQNHGDVPYQGRQSPGLSDVLHINILKEPPELDELHQLFTIVLGVESPGLRLHQHRLTEAQVPLSPIELDHLLPHGEGLLLSCQLLLPRQELLL